MSLFNKKNIKAEDLVKKWKTISTKQSVIGFYSNNNSYPEFSNFYKHIKFKFIIPEWCGICANREVEIDFTEKAIMLCKASIMDDELSFNKIIKSNKPMEVKMLGRKVENFNDELWKNNVCRIAKIIVFTKFSKVNGLKEKLLGTEDILIAEATERDKIWGIGMNPNNKDLYYPSKWKGSNILGWALMEARNELKIIRN